MTASWLWTRMHHVKRSVNSDLRQQDRTAQFLLGIKPGEKLQKVRKILKLSKMM